MNERFLLIISGAAIVGGISAIIFLQVQARNDTQPFVEQPQQTTQATTTSITVSQQGGITVKYYGGASDIKTFTEAGVEYALVRNPSNTGNLTLATQQKDARYYFAIDTEEKRIPYTPGTPDGLHGYDEVGLVSETLIRERTPVIEYFIAYPDAVNARIANMKEIDDTGIANRFLASQAAILTNKNTGKSVVAEIDHRSNQKGVLLISESVGRALELDNGATGNIEVTLVPKESVTLGPVR